MLGEDAEAADLRPLLLVNRMLTLGELDRMPEAESTLRQAQALAERTGTARAGMVAVAAVQWHFRTGRWDDAVAELESVAELQDTQHMPLFLHGLAALIAGHRDDRAASGAHLRAVADRPVSGTALSNAPYLLMARALAAEQGGRLEEALGVLAPTLRPEGEQDMEERYLWLPDVVRLGIAVGDLASQGTRLTRMAAGRCRGLVDADAVPLLAAADYYRGAGRPLELAQSLEDAAVLLARAGQREAARVAYAEAIEVYTGLGADWDIRRADDRARPLGIRRPRGPAGRARSGWESLTPVEVRIARLVAQGGSNPEIGAQLFLSRRTVQSHVSHVMAKLGVGSRVEVARETGLHPAAPANGPSEVSLD